MHLLLGIALGALLPVGLKALEDWRAKRALRRAALRRMREDVA
jgi:hypothetical protein